MGAINKYKKWHSGKERIDIAFSFRPNGATGVVAGSINGVGITSVTRTGVGAYDVVFKEAFGQLDCVTGSVREVSGDSFFVSFGVWDKANKTLEVYVYDEAGAAQDMADDPDNVVNVRATYRDSKEELY